MNKVKIKRREYDWGVVWCLTYRGFQYNVCESWSYLQEFCEVRDYLRFKLRCARREIRTYSRG